MRIGIVLASLCVLWTTSVEGDERDFSPHVVGNLVDRYQPITKFPVIAGRLMRLPDNELVLGVVVNGRARAYPINMLTGPSREILNDTLGKVPIAATW